MAILGRRTLKSSRRKAHRIDQAFSRACYAIMACYSLFAITAWITERDVFRIDQVSVSVPGKAIDTEAVRDLATTLMQESFLFKIDRNNVALLPRQSMASAIMSLDARVKGVTFDVEKRKKLTIAIDEYQPALLWCGEEVLNVVSTSTTGCYHADVDGYVFASAPEFSGYPFAIFRTGIAGSDEQGSPIGLFTLPKREHEVVARFRDELRKGGVVVREIIQKGEQDYALRIDAPWQILWSSKRDPAQTAEHLRISLPEIMNGMNKSGSSTPTYVDLRFENKIFYK